MHIVTDYNSIGYFVSVDTIAGFNHDLIQLIETYTPIKIEVVLESSLEKSIEGLKKGKYDVVARNTCNYIIAGFVKIHRADRTKPAGTHPT